MTISTESAPLSYSGDGATIAFPVTWKYFAKADVVATLRSSANVETTWTLDTEYTLSAAGVDAGGTLTAAAALAIGETLVIELEPANTQDSSLPAGGPFPSPVVEDGLDIAAQRDAKIEALFNRALRVPKTDTQTAGLLEIPIDADRASKILGFDGNGAPVALTQNPTGSTDVSGNLVTATGSTTARSLATRFADIINVKDYGAVLDGATDDAAAISAAIDIAVAARGAVYFPAGACRVATSISKTFSGDEFPLIFLGDGGDASVIELASNAGFSFTVDEENEIRISGLRFLPIGANTTSAVKITGPGSSTNELSLQILNCTFGPYTNTSSATNHFVNACIELDNLSIGEINGCWFSGKAEVDPSKTTGLLLSNTCNDITLRECRWQNVQYGIYGITTLTTEGFRVLGAVMVRAKYGIWLVGNVFPVPEFKFIDSHINASRRGIYLVGFTQSFISHNLFYNRTDSTETAFEDVFLDNCASMHVDGNTFASLSATVTDGVAVFIEGENSQSIISENIVKDRHVGFELNDSGTAISQVRFINNHDFSLKTAKNLYKITSATTTNLFWTLSDEELTSYLTLAATPTITTGTATTLAFAVTSSKHTALSLAATATAGELDVPNGVDALIFQIGCKVTYTAAANRIELRIQKDTGGGFSDVLNLEKNVTTPTYLHWRTKPIGVAPGDTIRIQIFQNSGNDAQVIHTDPNTYADVLTHSK